MLPDPPKGRAEGRRTVDSWPLRPEQGFSTVKGRFLTVEAGDGGRC